jgi:hypothetical protein
MVSKTILIALAAALQSGGAAQAWKPFSSTKGGYAVSLPVRPVERKQAITLPRAGKIDMNVASAKRSSAATYSVGVAELELDSDQASAILDAAREDVVKTLKGKLIDESPTDLNGSTGRELKIEIPKSVMAGGASGRARIYVIGPRLYEVIAVQSTAESHLNAAEVDQFFASFKPTKTPATTSEAATKKAKSKAAKNEVVAKTAEKPAPPATTPPQDPNAPKPGWQTYKSDDDTFTVAFPPGTIDEQGRRTKDVGGPSGFQSASVKVGVGSDYRVSYVRIFHSSPSGPDAIETELDRSIDRMNLIRQGTTLVSKTKIQLDGFPGREYTRTKPDLTGNPMGGLILGRMYIVGDRLYELTREGSKADVSSDETTLFFNSFKLLPKAVAGLTPGGTLPEWRAFTSTEGRYSVLLPGFVTEEVQKSNAGAAGEIEFHVMKASRAGAEVFLVVYLDVPATEIVGADLERVYDALQSRLLVVTKGEKGAIQAQSKVMLGDLPGRELKIDRPVMTVAGGGFAQVRIFLKGSRLYQVAFLGSKQGMKSADITKFMDSFRITK